MLVQFRCFARHNKQTNNKKKKNFFSFVVFIYYLLLVCRMTQICRSQAFIVLLNIWRNKARRSAHLEWFVLFCMPWVIREFSFPAYMMLKMAISPLLDIPINFEAHHFDLALCYTIVVLLIPFMHNPVSSLCPTIEILMLLQNTIIQSATNSYDLHSSVAKSRIHQGSKLIATACASFVLTSIWICLSSPAIDFAALLVFFPFLVTWNIRTFRAAEQR